VIARPGAELDEDGVRDYCRKHMAHFKVPRYVMFVEDFPMTITGKVQKFKMRDASIERLGLQEAAAVRNA
jgi:fatty-acyl-CoA synthase